MNTSEEYRGLLNRRQFLGGALGMAALAHLGQAPGRVAAPGLPGLPHFAPKAKRVIYLFQGGGPSQMDLFDYKPQLAQWSGKDLPDSVRNGQRLTSMTAAQTAFPIVPSLFQFARHGQSGAWVSDLMPYTAKRVDDLCFIKSMYTEQINHDPAVTFAQTGFQLSGRPSLGAWVTYGLGSENQNLPGFVVILDQKGGPYAGPYEGLIRERKHGGLAAAKRADRRPERAAHAGFVEGVEDVTTGQAVEGGQHLLVLEADDDQRVLESGLQDLSDLASDEGLASEGQEQLGRAHARRGAGGKDDRADHDAIVVRRVRPVPLCYNPRFPQGAAAPPSTTRAGKGRWIR